MIVLDAVANRTDSTPDLIAGAPRSGQSLALFRAIRKIPLLLGITYEHRPVLIPFLQGIGRLSLYPISD